MSRCTLRDPVTRIPTPPRSSLRSTWILTGKLSKMPVGPAAASADEPVAWRSAESADDLVYGPLRGGGTLAFQDQMDPGSTFVSHEFVHGGPGAWAGGGSPLCCNF